MIVGKKIETRILVSDIELAMFKAMLCDWILSVISDRFEIDEDYSPHSYHVIYTILCSSPEDAIILRMSNIPDVFYEKFEICAVN